MVDRLTLLQLTPGLQWRPARISLPRPVWETHINLPACSMLSSGDPTLFEHRGQAVVTAPILAFVRPMAYLGLYPPDMAAWSVGWARHRGWLTANDRFRRRCSICWERRARWPRGTSPTMPGFRGSRRVGPTTESPPLERLDFEYILEMYGRRPNRA